jgi:hypothetical protein
LYATLQLQKAFLTRNFDLWLRTRYKSPLPIQSAPDTLIKSSGIQKYPEHLSCGPNGREIPIGSVGISRVDHEKSSRGLTHANEIRLHIIDLSTIINLVESDYGRLPPLDSRTESSPYTRTSARWANVRDLLIAFDVVCAK